MSSLLGPLGRGFLFVAFAVSLEAQGVPAGKDPRKAAEADLAQRPERAPEFGQPPEVKQSREGWDDPEARRRATVEWFGGEPTVEYLDAKKALARQELKRWAWSFPGYRGPRPSRAIPGSDRTWTNLGPRGGRSNPGYVPAASADVNVDSGRIALQGIVTHPTDARILYVATAGGGVWKTTNADLNAAGDWTWTAITDSLPNATGTGNIACGALAMSPTQSDTLYLGLGDFYMTQGRGFYRTTNGGGTWEELGSLGQTTSVHAILPLDTSTILVGGNKGLFRSTNGGTSFSPVSLDGATTRTIWSLKRCGATGLILSSQDAEGPGQGRLWHSQDAGASWEEATYGDLLPVRPDLMLGRITLDALPSSSDRAFGIAEQLYTGQEVCDAGPTTKSETFVGYMRSADCGATWIYELDVVMDEASDPPDPPSAPLFGGEGQAFYNQALAVDPDDASRIFAGYAYGLYRSVNSGLMWKSLTNWWANQRVYGHADLQTMAWSKTGPRTLFVGNDGGLMILRDPFRTLPPQGSERVESDVTFVDNRRNRGITSHLAYAVGSTTASSPGDSRWRIAIGLQDNSLRVRRSSGSDQFDDAVAVGDGTAALWHPTDGNRVLIGGYNLSIKRSTTAGEAQQDIGAFHDSVLPHVDDCEKPFFVKLVSGLAPEATADWVYTSSKMRILRSTNFGSSWQAIYEDVLPGGTIRNLASSRSRASTIAVIFSSGGARRSPENEDPYWVHFGPLPNSGGSLSYVWFDTTDDQVMYIASVALDATKNHLWKSTNGGASWVPIDGGAGSSNGFPFGIPVHVIQHDPTNRDTLLAATDFGAYISTNGGSSWVRYGQGMPMVAIKDLYIAPDGSFVRAATFGRGVWEITP